MATIRDKYTEVEQTWPEQVPPLAAHEAVRAAKRLYRFVTGKTWTGPVRVVSGRNYTYVRAGVMRVNPNRIEDHKQDDGTWIQQGGWRTFVHELSHYLHRRVGTDKPHSKQHARLEARMVREVIKRGWLNGTLKTEPKPVVVETPQDRSNKKLIQIDAKIARWTTKAKRAATALKKLNRQRKYYYAQRTA